MKTEYVIIGIIIICILIIFFQGQRQISSIKQQFIRGGGGHGGGGHGGGGHGGGGHGGGGHGGGGHGGGGWRNRFNYYGGLSNGYYPYGYYYPTELTSEMTPELCRSICQLNYDDTIKSNYLEFEKCNEKCNKM